MGTDSGASVRAGTSGPIELRLSLPCDVRFVTALEAVAVFAAETGGFTHAAAAGFGQSVVHAVREFVSTHRDPECLPVVLRRQRGSVDVVVGDSTLTLRS
jgi:hypothetical protein